MKTSGKTAGLFCFAGAGTTISMSMGNFLRQFRSIRAVSAGLLVGLAMAQAAPLPASQNDGHKLVMQLGAEVWAQREAALRALCLGPTSALPWLEKELQATHDPEVAARLVTICTHLHSKNTMILTGTTPILGISYAPQRGSEEPGAAALGGILIQETLIGLPAYELLETGDVITHLNGQALGDQTDPSQFRTLIAQEKPGALVSLTVLRGGKTITVRLLLAGVPKEFGGNASLYMRGRMEELNAYRQRLMLAPVFRGLDIATEGNESPPP